MRKNLLKLITLSMTMALMLSFSGCMESSGFSLETTTSSNPSATSSSVRPYVRKDYDSSKYPYYSRLDETEKDAYSLICEELTKGNQKFECNINLNSDQLTKAIDSVLADHPELFWVDNTYGYTYDPATGEIKEITFDFFDFADTPEKLASAKIEFSTIADSIIAQSLTYQTAVEREVFIHDYIGQNTTYDASADYNQSAYSVLVLHKSVCAGYARCFQYLSQRAGITCYYVTGRAEGLSGQSLGGNSDGSHSWNIVALDGEYYNVDCLWDDTASETYGSLIYPFFNLTDDALVYHVRTGNALFLPNCTATKYKYSNQFGATIEADGIIFEDAV